MKISSTRILELNEKYNLIGGLSEREATNPEGSGFDLRVGRVDKIVGESFLGVAERRSPETELLGEIERDGTKSITIVPGETYLVQTIETVNAPKEKVKYDPNFPEAYLGIDISARTSLMRGGIQLLHGRVNPGYKGPLTMAIHNSSKYNFIFELGPRMFDIEFVPVIGELTRTYSGQHQGGRVTSGGVTETQN